MASAIDLNGDLDEAPDPHGIARDEALLPLLTSINVACGFHASDPSTMWRTVNSARRYGVAVGAHPGFPDRMGFGRREMAVHPEECEADVIYQVGALMGFCRAAGVRLQHVKPHGALYHQASRDPDLAAAVALAVRAVDPGLILVAPPGSALAAAGERAGLRVAREAFVDRGYAADGTLVPRGHPIAVINDPRLAARQAVRLAYEGVVRSVTGVDVAVPCDTLCIHGDHPQVLEVALAVREALALANVTVRPLSG